MPLQERLLALTCEDPVDGLAAEAQAQGEQRALHRLPAQSHPDLGEVDLGLLAGGVDLRHEPVQVHAALSFLLGDLPPTLVDVVEHRRIRSRGETVFPSEPGEDPLGRVPLLARCRKVLAQHCVDRRLDRVEHRRRARRHGLTRG